MSRVYVNASHKMFYKDDFKLTLIIGELEVVIHGGYELLNKEASNAGRQVLFAFHFTFQHICVEICEKDGRRNDAGIQRVIHSASDVLISPASVG